MNTGSNYPRMLFRGDETSRADSRDELLAKRAQGWRATLLPGETPEDIGETEEAHVSSESLPGGAPAASAPTVGDEAESQVARPKRGRPKKHAG